MKPRDLAEQIVRALPDDSAIKQTEIAGPGFINFFVSDASHFDILRVIREQGREFGRQNLGHDTSIQVEFVSANPTGPCTWVMGAVPPMGPAWPTCWRPSATAFTASTM